MKESLSSVFLKTLYLFAIVGGLALALSATGFVAAYTYDKVFDGRILPGIVIGDERLDGLHYDKARAIIEDTIDTATRNGFAFQFRDKTYTLSRTSVPLEDPDVATDLLDCRPDEALKAAFETGRGQGFVLDALTRVRLALYPKHIDMPCKGDGVLLKKQLNAILAEEQSPAIDARLTTTETSGTTPVIVVEAEKIGISADIDGAVARWLAMTKRMQYQQIAIASNETLPRVTKSQLEPLVNEAPAFLAKAPVTLLLDRTPYTVTTSTLAEWLTATATASGYKLSLSPDAIVETLAKPASVVVQEAKNGYLEMNSDNTIKTFTAPVEGVAIDGSATAKALLDSFNATSTKKTAIAVSFTRSVPRIEGPDAERLGIRDLLGVGNSYFDGSPANRRKNIAKGKEKMNGVLIAPGEVFSQLKTLGSIDGANGWYPELVIKGDKTTPEFGGGLCQIGSTSFRAAMAAGLKIVERRNHSYRVRYYEPIGTDATIYEPSPDFKFKNDTPAHILITTEMKGDALHFYVWGTNDGRKAEQKLSGAYNIIPAPPTKYIETTDLKPGQKHCTESAHAGATAHVDYSVTYADGTSSTERFVSVYKPWGAVCLVGSDKNTPSTVDETGINNPN